MPTGTVGGRTAPTSSRRANSWRPTSAVRASSPITHDAIGTDACPPAEGSAARNCAIVLRSAERRSSPSPLRAISTARRVAAATCGGNPVVKISGRARFHSRSAIARVVAANAPNEPSALPKVPITMSAPCSQTPLPSTPITPMACASSTIRDAPCRRASWLHASMSTTSPSIENTVSVTTIRRRPACNFNSRSRSARSRCL